MYDDVVAVRGNYRAVVESEPFAYDFKPDGCWFGTVYGGERGDFEVLGTDPCRPSPDIDMSDLWDYFRDWTDVELCLRGVRDVCDVCGEYITLIGETWWADGGELDTCYDDNDPHVPTFDLADRNVVAFGVRYVDRARYVLVNVVTRDDVIGWGSLDLLETVPGVASYDPCPTILDAWEAWAEGDVWYVRIEECMTTETTRYNVRGDVVDTEESETWDLVDSCSGFYGREDAERSALETLDYYAPATV